jgi:hypothetical protein
MTTANYAAKIQYFLVTDYSIAQTTHLNRQVITITAVSDLDYIISYEEE